MNIQLVRHATHLIFYKGKRLLLDPMFSKKGTLQPVLNAPNEHLNNPLTELPIEPEHLTNVDAVLVTHTHRDHFDDAAVSVLPKDLLIFCQPEDEEGMKEKGFTNIVPVSKGYTWEGIEFIRTNGQHGTGELGRKMGPVSGFILRTDGEPVLYIIGDSIWYGEIEKVFDSYSPEVAIVFAGEAQYLEGDPITMGLVDIQNIVEKNPTTDLVISHMESWNHCVLKREDVHQYIEQNGLQKKIYVPENGDTLEWMG
jgi:L-ascorbate metabolism protein UlaG (beta-lactamase superfamily)